MEDWDIDLDETGAASNAGMVIDRMERAALLMRKDPLRGGNLIVLHDRGDVVVLGDLHGDQANFERVYQWAHLHVHRDRYLVCQELIHGGPDDGSGGGTSYRLLERAAELKVRYGSQFQMILSNHDLAEITGSAIYKGGERADLRFRHGIRNAYGDAADDVLQAYHRFLGSLPLAVKTDNGLWVSHSTPRKEALGTFDYSIFHRQLRPQDLRPGTSVHELVWGRNHTQACADEFAEETGAKLFITGHQTSMPGLKTPTSRHIVVTSDGPLGRFVVLPLAGSIPHGVATRHVRKIRNLDTNDSR